MASVGWKRFPTNLLQFCTSCEQRLCDDLHLTITNTIANNHPQPWKVECFPSEGPILPASPCSLLKWITKTFRSSAEGRIHWSRHICLSSKGPSSSPALSVRQLTTSNSKGSDVLSWSLWQHAHTYTLNHTYIHIQHTYIHIKSKEIGSLCL